MKVTLPQEPSFPEKIYSHRELVPGIYQVRYKGNPRWKEEMRIVVIDRKEVENTERDGMGEKNVVNIFVHRYLSVKVHDGTMLSDSYEFRKVSGDSITITNDD